MKYILSVIRFSVAKLQTLREGLNNKVFFLYFSIGKIINKKVQQSYSKKMPG